ncbi:MAG: TonB-dependent receptor plug domain-containing protein [Gemmatimonadota bacterium]
MNSKLCLRRATLPVALVALSACASGGSPDAVGTATPQGSSATTITAEEIQQTPDQGVERLLSGRVAGVSLIQTANGLSVRIRGATSINGSTEPLYVIDGMPIEPGPGGSLAGISTRDIESIEVLKDAADTALYGVRGANGVIVIKLKGPGVNAGSN